MYSRIVFLALILTIITRTESDKINLDTLNNYSEFLNFGEKKLMKLSNKNADLENSVIKSKIDVLGEIFKKNIDSLKVRGKLDLIFLIDGSSSVGESNFKSELKFVKKILSDVTVDYNHTRVAIITFSNEIIKNIDEISQPKKENNKCLLFNKQINNIRYTGGGTFTLEAFQMAKNVFKNSRNDSAKVLFLITDGFSNGGNPVPLAKDLKQNQITIFTIGIQNGNYKELYELATQPGEYYSFLLDSYQEFESLARRALHVDLKSGDYIPLGIDSPCDSLCEEGNCCDSKALCTCGTTTGHYSCVCQPGYYGSGLQNSCLPCSPGTYSNGLNLCLPCPDMYHTTKPPALSIESCKCKSGYQATSDNKCEILKCPKISTPEHGYFVKKRDCTSILNTACGIRCEVGYTLVGTSIRLCQINASWSGDAPSCQVKTCKKLSPPAYGSMVCSHTDLGIIYNGSESSLPVDTVCTFQCEDGKTLTGSAERTCMPLARWDGFKNSCKQIKCPKLPQISNGQIEPKSCTTGKQPYGQNCTIICNEGFKIDGPSMKMCTGNHGLWDSKLDDTVCKDITPPNIYCPDNITTSTLLGKKFGLTSWIQPEVIDNSDMEVLVWMKPAIKDFTNFKFQIGQTKVTYFAQDAFHNRAKCSFFVIVKDVERPVIENCLSPPAFLTNEKVGSNIEWDEPHIFDNSQKVKIIKSHDFGYFPVGTTTVNYTALDETENRNECLLNITVEAAHCEALSDPIYGHSECSSDTNSMQCVITCQEGYAVPLSQPQHSLEDDGNSSISFLCNNIESIWYNHEGLLFPECSVTEIPKETEHSGTLSIISDSDICNDTTKLDDFDNNVKITLQENSCFGDCIVNTNITCGDDKSSDNDDEIEEKTNKIKRQIDDSFSKRKPLKKANRVNVKFQVKGSNVTRINQNLTKNLNFNGHFNVTVQYQKSKIHCLAGFVPRRHRCVQCPKGTFHNATRNKCQNCPFGFYNDKVGQSNCLSCPLHYSTRKLHSKKFSDCKEQCPPGTFARKKLVKQSKHNQHRNMAIERATLKPFCRSCPIASYQPDYGQTSCLACPQGHTTASTNSTRIDQCFATSAEICRSNLNICNGVGRCIVDSEFHYSCSCPEDYIGSHCETRASDCDSNPCLNRGVCRMDAYAKVVCQCPRGYLGRHCEKSDEKCLLICLNNGTCVHNDANDYLCLCPKGFGGDTCEIKLTHCMDNLCENNSTCLEDANTFRCKCSNGFIGRRCNILPCDYRPCNGSNSICVNSMEANATRTSFNCVCPEGYTGSLCNERIDYCQDMPCLNGGVCINSSNDTESTGYSCVCTKLFAGARCERKKLFNYTINFEKFSTTDYVKLSGFEHNYTQISACLWMQTLDQFNYGTLLSYATKSFDNAFTITDYTGLVLYVNNNHIVTDILLNDGNWHHVCVTWASLKGQYEIYIDGKLSKTGLDLATNMHIEGHGNMVIGQEQDILGGKFSQSESFLGKMAYIDIWSNVLTLDEITKHMNDCQELVYGNIYSWPEIQDNVQGNVQIENLTFCKRCTNPKMLYNGIINLVDNVAYYDCYKGFKLVSTVSYNKGRKCTKVSTWEGLNEPYCKRVFCGNPGFLRNGYTIGTDYFYQDAVTFVCHDGYNLKGSSMVSCSENGTWVPGIPKCLGAQCIAFKKPDNSNLTIIAEHSYEDFIEDQSTFDIGTQVEIVCDQSANLTGESVLTCQENGTWDFPPPKCGFPYAAESDDQKAKSKSDCEIDKIPPAPDNGYIDLESQYAVGNGTTDTVEYKCRNGYILHGDNFTACIIDGYWTAPNISCDPIVCHLPKFKTMIIKDEINLSSSVEYTLGNMIRFECIDGYDMGGDSTMRCLANGRWSKMRGRCTRKLCMKPIVAETTIITGNSYLFNDEVKITCASKSEYSLKCNSSGLWEGAKDESC